MGTASNRLRNDFRKKVEQMRVEQSRWSRWGSFYLRVHHQRVAEQERDLERLIDTAVEIATEGRDVNPVAMEFKSDALYSLERLAGKLGCSTATVLRNFKCQVRLAGCISGADILRGLHAVPAAMPVESLPQERRKRGRPIKSAAVHFITGGRGR
jgi:AraC-like DNA-binding protein